MAKSNYIFVDSNIWVALYSEKDSLHKKAGKVFSDLEKSGSRILVSDYVIQETFTVLSRMHHPAMALSFYEFITQHKNIDIIDVSSFFLQKVIEFIKYRELTQALGLIDYSVIFFSLLVDCPILSFDKQLIKTAQETGAAIA